MLLEALLAHVTQALAFNRDVLIAECPRPLCLEERRPHGKYLLSLTASFSEWNLSTLLMECSPIEAAEVPPCAPYSHRAYSMRPAPFHILPE